MRTVYGDHERFVQTYFSTYKGLYFTGDGCRRDDDGYYWITGRVDDVLNVSGHRLGTAEVESALVAHDHVAEAAVVGYPHPIKGQGIYAYVTLMSGVAPDEALRKELVPWVRKEIGPFAAPDIIQFAPGLPKTRSGKIMRRILRKIAEDDFSNLGDTSTLADPAVVDGSRQQPAEQGGGVGRFLQRLLEQHFAVAGEVGEERQAGAADGARARCRSMPSAIVDRRAGPGGRSRRRCSRDRARRCGSRTDGREGAVDDHRLEVDHRDRRDDREREARRRLPRSSRRRARSIRAPVVGRFPRPAAGRRRRA